MIYAKDAFLLARTKLKLRILRLSLTIFASSLLFAVLIFIGLAMTGLINSANDFGKQGLGGRFLVQAKPMTYNILSYEASKAEAIVKQLEPLQKSLIAERQAAAKKLNITYDPQQDQSLPVYELKDRNGTIMGVSVNYESPYTKKYLDKLNREKSALSYDSFRQKANAGGAINTFRSVSKYQGSMAALSHSYNVLDATKIEMPTDMSKMDNSTQFGLDTLTDYGWSTHDDALLKPFLLSGQSLEVGKDGSVPIIAPQSAAEEILGLKSLPSSANNTDKLNRLKAVRDGIAGKTAQICDRNSVSTTLFKQAIDQQKDIEANKNNASYVKPSLIYQPPTTKCGPTTIKQDTRTDEEKTRDENKKQLDKLMGLDTEQEQTLVTIRIVGITKDFDYESRMKTSRASMRATELIDQIVGSGLGSGWFIPASASQTNSDVKKVFGNSDYDSLLMDNNLLYYAEFKNLDAMKSFIKSYDCYSGSGGMQSMREGFQACVDQGKPFSIAPYGSNAGGIQELKNNFWSVFRYVILAIVLIAALVLMSNISKILSDSRRETAVFRALGAKRLDVAQIYIVYSLILVSILSVIATTIGVAAAFILDLSLSSTVSKAAVIAYNSTDLNKEFHLFSFDIRILLAVIGLILVATMLSIILPLVGNLRRNPIRDMRDEG